MSLYSSNQYYLNMKELRRENVYRSSKILVLVIFMKDKCHEDHVADLLYLDPLFAELDPSLFSSC